MSAAAVVTGLDLLIQFVDRAAAASAVLKNARAAGREPTSAELAELRGSLDSHLDELDAAIARARAEGR